MCHDNSHHLLKTLFDICLCSMLMLCQTSLVWLVTPIVGVCNCSMFCCTICYVHSSIAIILMGKRELVALLYLSSWCLVMVERLFLGVPRGCLHFVIVLFPDHTHLLFLLQNGQFRISSLFWRQFFFTIATKKVKLISDFYTWAIVLIN